MTMTDASVPRPRRGGRPGTAVTIDQAMAAIADGSRVFSGGGCGPPTGLLEAMVEARDRWTSLEIVCDYLLAPLPVFDYPNEPFRMISLHPSPATDKMRDGGALGTIPSSLRHYARYTDPEGPLPLDVALIHVSPPGPDGKFSLGAAVGTPIEMMANAPLVIAQVNPQMPYTFGAGEVDRDEIDLLVEVDHPLTELPPSDLNDTAKQIGALVAGQIPDRSVIQFGVGAIPKAVLLELSGHKDLGVHGGMVGDTIVDLYESGAITGAYKSTWPGKMVVGAVLGSAPSFAFVDRNPEVLMVPSSISHGVMALGKVDRFVSINSAIEVALDGSINAETAGGRVLSGPGGQPDYLIGAAEAAHGRSIIAMPSTAGRDGSRSRIVSKIDAAATVTVARSLADIIVTEFGVAHLKGKTLPQRAEALRAIAHPDLRSELEG